MSKGISVYVRAADGGAALHLCDAATVDEADKILSHIKSTGVYADGDVQRAAEAQYVIDEDDAYFEIVVG